MIKIQAYFPEDLYLQIKLIAKAENKNFSDLLRQIASNYVSQKKTKKKLKTVTIKSLSTTNAALTHNDIYDS